MRAAGPAQGGCPVGRFGYLEIVHTSDVLDDAAGQRRPKCRCGRRSASWFSWTSPTRLVLARWYLYPMLLRRVAFPDFCEPCLPSPAAKPPAGAGWLHEIKHDGFRMLVRAMRGAPTP